jgi:hypothetical protein
MQNVTLSETAVAVLRFEIKGWKSKRPESRQAAYRELAEAGIMELVPGKEADYRLTEWGRTHAQEVVDREYDRIERARFEPPDASNLSETARALLRRRLAGDDFVTPENLEAYRELAAARIMYPVSTFARGPESVFRFTIEGWERREEWVNERAAAPSLILRASSLASNRIGKSVSGACS